MYAIQYTNKGSRIGIHIFFVSKGELKKNYLVYLFVLLIIIILTRSLLLVVVGQSGYRISRKRKIIDILGYKFATS